MNTARVLKITQNESGHMYAMAKRRKQYVAYLHKHEHDSKMSSNNVTKILNWAKRRMTLSDKVC